jgi:hypothetical protein
MVIWGYKIMSEELYHEMKSDNFHLSGLKVIYEKEFEIYDGQIDYLKDEVETLKKQLDELKRDIASEGYTKSNNLMLDGDYKSWEVYAVMTEYEDGRKMLKYKVTVDGKDYDITELEFTQLCRSYKGDK